MKIYHYILIGIFVIIFLIFFHGFYKRLKLLRMFYGSYMSIFKLGLIIAISGVIRAGKSTLTAGLTHLFTFKIQNDLRAKIEEIEVSLKEINFVNLRKQIDLLPFSLDQIDTLFNVLVSNYLIPSNDKFIFTNKLSEAYFDFLNYQDKLDLLKEYVICYLHLKRDSFIFSNIRMYNQITRSYAKEFSNDWIKLKNNNSFPLLPFSVMVEDDKLIYDSNIGYMKKLHEDTGSDLFYRLYGHLFKEKSYYICTVQDVNRWIKLEREIAQTHIFVFKSNIVGNYPKINFLLILIENILRFFYNQLRKYSKNDRYFNNNNWFKAQFYKIKQSRKKLFSKSFVFYEAAVYSNIDHVGKEIKEDDLYSYYIDFVLPIPYVFGILNTHEFNILYDHLYERSDIKYSNLKEMQINENEILDILKKYQESSTTNNSKMDNNLDDIF